MNASDPKLSAWVAANAGSRVLLLNRDIKPGGLAEYGIFLDKYKMKGGLRRQFHKILSDSRITYLGNVPVGPGGPLTVEQLLKLGFDALVFAHGAQGTKYLGVEGERLPGVYHAKDLVYHYNRHPPFAERDFRWEEQFEPELLVKRALSVSFVAALPPERQDEVAGRVREALSSLPRPIRSRFVTKAFISVRQTSLSERPSHR